MFRLSLQQQQQQHKIIQMNPTSFQGVPYDVVGTGILNQLSEKMLYFHYEC